MYRILQSLLTWGRELPFGFGKLKVIADLDEQLHSSGRDRRQNVISSIIDFPFHRMKRANI